MGNKITDSLSMSLSPEPSPAAGIHSRFVLSDDNLHRMEQDVLEFSGVPREWMWRIKVEVG